MTHAKDSEARAAEVGLERQVLGLTDDDIRALLSEVDRAFQTTGSQ